MLLLALALAPGFAIAFYIYCVDKYDREPLRKLLICFILGALVTIPAALIETFAGMQLDNFMSSRSFLYHAILSFGIVALVEEYLKFFVVRNYAYRQKEFNEPFDGITYSVMVSMGFATLENVSYVFQSGFATAIGRMFLSVPAHGAFGVLMGYHIGLAKMNPANASKHMLKGLLLAIFFHGAFDFFLFLQRSREVRRIFSEGMLTAATLVIFYIAIRLAFRAIRLHQALSKQQFSENRNLP
jgi:protease PrsW